MDRRCSLCGERKPVAAFSRKGTGLQSRCRDCNRRYLKVHYAANRSYYLDKSARWKRAAKIRYHTRLRAYFAAHPCTDCGESDPVVLQFDHVRGTKLADVGMLVRSGYPWARIEAEIEKCEVRCANCHWRRTARQFNWYAYMDDADGGG